MSVECFPITVLPHVSQIYRDYLAMADLGEDAAVRQWFGAEPFSGSTKRKGGAPNASDAEAEQMASSWPSTGDTIVRTKQLNDTLADLLDEQAETFQASAPARENIAKLRNGARAIVTGQQVVLFGGPLLTLLKTATAIARAKEAAETTGVPHVPIFWMATEDHDLAEVDQVSLLTKTSVETLRAGLKIARAIPVGGVIAGSELGAVLDRAAELLEYAPISEWLRECYLPKASAPCTLAVAFGRLMARIFAEHGLIVMDAASRGFHSLGSSTLRYAIEHASELQKALLNRTTELVEAGYHAQVLVSDGASLLFLMDEFTGERIALRRVEPVEGGDQWKAGNRSYSTPDLLAILDTEPERLSPNALLRPVFQDTLLPTAAYIGGPSEIAYFAQSAVLYRAILGRVTPVLPRLSATLLEPAIAAVMDKDEVQLPDAMTSPEALAQRLGARAMPIGVKRKLAAVGNALEAELLR